jgi:hypothetical protein
MCLLCCYCRPQVIVGNASWRFGSYLSYCRSGAEMDEMPLYMFDKVRVPSWMCMQEELVCVCVVGGCRGWGFVCGAASAQTSSSLQAG